MRLACEDEVKEKTPLCEPSGVDIIYVQEDLFL